MSVVRPEFGPTLPELLGPRVRALPRAVRAALVAVVVALVLLAGYAFVTRHAGVHTAQVNGAVPFNLQYQGSLHRVAARPGELLALQDATGKETFTIRPVSLPAYRGDVGAVLMSLATDMITQMRATVPGFVLRAEGRARIANQPGYQIQYQFKLDGRTAYGRRVLLTTGQPGVRHGVDIDLRVPRSPQVPNFDVVGTAGTLKQSLRSFAFGS